VVQFAVEVGRRGEEGPKAVTPDLARAGGAVLAKGAAVIANPPRMVEQEARLDAPSTPCGSACQHPSCAKRTTRVIGKSGSQAIGELGSQPVPLVLLVANEVWRSWRSDCRLNPKKPASRKDAKGAKKC